MKTARIILSLGSNTNQEANIREAKQALTALLPDIVFSQDTWTAPIGMVSDKFLNCVAHATTTTPLATLRREIKQIELSLGNKDHATNTVHIDIDLLQYGNRRYKEEDWKRDYVAEYKNERLRD